jgi:hypothetical protein
MTATATAIQPSDDVQNHAPVSLADVPDLKSAGVSGTREEMTSEQQHAFFALIIDAIRLGVTEFHHGACTGADAFVHFHLQRQMVMTHVHPATDTEHSAMGFLVRHNRRVDHDPKPYAERNQDIVNASDVLIAAPRYAEKDPRSKRSGTWMTVRKAAAAHKLALVVAADGKVTCYGDEN